MKGNAIKPEHLRFMKNFMDRASSSKLLCRNNVDGVATMALIQVMTEKVNRELSDIIFSRVVITRGDTNVSSLVYSVWNLDDVSDNSYYLIAGANIDSALCKKIDAINTASIKRGNGYRIMLINTSVPVYLRQYEWALCPEDEVTTAGVMFEFVKELDKTRSDKERTRSEMDLRRKTWDNKNFYALIKAAEALSLNNLNTLYGRIGIQMSLVLSDLSHREVSAYVRFVATECVFRTFLLEACYNENPNIETMLINCNDEDGRYSRAYHRSMRSAMQTVNRMEAAAIKCDVTDLLSNTPCEGLSTYLIIGVPGSSSAAPTTIWLNRHPEVDIAIFWDYEHFERLTFRTIKPIDLVPIANKYLGDVSKIGTAGKSSSMFRIPFKPEHLVFVGKLNNKECGFGGEFING